MNRRSDKVCVYYLNGTCRFGSNCWFNHEIAVNQNQESDCCSATASAPAVSLGGTPVAQAQKSCGICLDVVKTKFGLMAECNHCFCFECLRKWRNTKEIEVCKSCPECRTHVEYVFLSHRWFDEPEQKNKYIEQQKNKMKAVDCHFFRKGSGKCPFGNSCMYLHALNDGTEVDVGPPFRSEPNNREDRSSENVERLVTWFHAEFNDSSSDSSSHELLDNLNRTLSGLYHFDWSMLDLDSD